MRPICLVIGFLGSGKTTFLEKVAARSSLGRLAFLINEFASVDIDGQRLSRLAPDIVSLPGGSIFCRCLVTEFIRVLRDLASPGGTAEPVFEGLVIEASGMANPKVVEQMLGETRLDQHYRLASIVALVDPGSFRKLRHTLPNILAQIEAADILILNKVDCYPEALIGDTEQEIRRLNARATLLRASFGDVPVDLFPESRPVRALQGDYAPCRDPNYVVLQCHPRQPLDLEKLDQILTRHRDIVYRAKGSLLAGGHWRDVDFSESGFSLRPCLDQEARTMEWVVVVRGADEDEARRELIEPIERGDLDQGPQTA